MSNIVLKWVFIFCQEKSSFGPWTLLAIEKPFFQDVSEMLEMTRSLGIKKRSIIALAILAAQTGRWCEIWKCQCSFFVFLTWNQSRASAPVLPQRNSVKGYSDETRALHRESASVLPSMDPTNLQKPGFPYQTSDLHWLYALRRPTRNTNMQSSKLSTDGSQLLW